MNRENAKLMLSNLIANKMKVNDNMLHLGMKYRISIEISGPHIVTVDGGSGRKVDTKFNEEILNPVKFSRC